MVKEHVAVLPTTSVAVHVTIVVPMGKNVPEGGEQVAAPAPQASVTVGAGYGIGAPDCDGVWA